MDVGYGPNSADVTGPLERAIRALGRVDTGTGEPPQELRGVGFGRNGQVRAEASASGRLEALTIDPALSRLDTATIAEYVLEAVRAAQDDAQRQLTESLSSAAALDATGLSRELGEVAVEATRGFDRMLADLDAMLRRLDRA
jgi:DNA-binding protein YbaB